MTYSEWRTENEEKYSKLADDGGLDKFPAFDPKTRTDKIYEEAEKITDDLIDNDLMTPVHFGCVFAEYLFEKYNMDPLDAEIMGLYFSKGMLAFSAKMSAQAVTAIFDKTTQEN